MNAIGYLDPTVDSTVEAPVDVELYPRTAPIWPRTLNKQWANSPRIQAWIQSFSDAIDPDALSDLFYDEIWNVLTAGSFGLDVWGRIVDVRRALFVPGGQTGRLFGWGNAGADKYFGWRQAPFNSGNKVTPNYVLLDDDYRRLILVKAFSNISDRAIPTMNKALMLLFAGRGDVYVDDLGGMTAAYVFTFQPTPLDLAILQQSGAFANPTGVAMSVVTP